MARFFRRGQLPLLILRLLQQHEEMYGYQIREAVNRLTEGKYELKEGTLYPLLHLLEDQGFVESEWRVSKDMPPRRYYRLTSEGVRYLEGEARFAAFLWGDLWGKSDESVEEA